MRKSERAQVFAKFGGKCAYCGCDLEKGWHVDHIEACRRKRRWVDGGCFDKATGLKLSYKDTKALTEDEYEARVVWREGKWVDDGFSNPEANHMDNYMPSCPSCNINKHGDTIEQFRENIAGYLRSLNLRVVQYKMVKKYGLVEETEAEVVFHFERSQQ